MSKRQAEPITENATAKQMLVGNLSANEKIEEDNKADDVCQCGKNNPSQTGLGVTPCDNKVNRWKAVLYAWQNHGKDCRSRPRATAKHAKRATL